MLPTVWSRWILGAFLCACAVTAQAEEAGWRFADLMEVTLRDYPEIIAKQRSVDAARSEVEGAEWQRYPAPGVQAAMNSNGGRTDPVFSLRQPLWTGGRITAGIDAARARHGAADAEVLVTRRSLLLRLTSTYSNLRRTQIQLDLHRQNVKRHEGLLEMIGRRVKNQVSPEVDLNLANNRLLQAKNELSQIVQNFSNGTMQMSELVGRKVNKLDLADLPDLSELPKTLEEATAQTMATAPGLVKQDFELQAAQADVDSAEAAYWPKVVLHLEEQFGSKSEHKASISLESQLGAGLSSVTNIDAVQSRRQGMIEDRRKTVLQITTSVAEVWNAYNGARYRLENNRTNYKSSEAIFESYTRLYVAGQKSWLDVMNSAKDTFNSSLAVEDTEADRLSSALSLLVHTGRL
ncbi:MAG: TolC family protein [Magnetococcales bacterium]|nr:TolC family protein [Magnetococcales bacterium]NGZ07402.1 TolC family protein [Magnetococcales bacterium]